MKNKIKRFFFWLRWRTRISKEKPTCCVIHHHLVEYHDPYEKFIRDKYDVGNSLKRVGKTTTLLTPEERISAMYRFFVRNERV